MAKKKTAPASPFVPAEEQPYPIPDNWCWVHLLDSFENHTDSKKKVQSKKYLEEGKLVVVDQGQALVGGYTDDENMAHSGQLPVIIFGDHTRCVKYIDFPFAQGADGIKVLSPKSFYDAKAFYFALQSIDIPNMGYRRHYPLFPQFCIPLPPLPEQHRIVTRIESLFAKLDEAKEKAQAVVDGFELRKSAILHKAFTGELTEKWRKENGVGLESWETQKFGQVVENLDAKRIPLSQQQRSDMCRRYDYYGASGVIDKVDDYLFDGRYLLIGEDGANLVTRSKPIAFIAEGQYWVNNHAHILATCPQIIMDFLCYYINSIDLIPYVTGSAQPKLTQNKMNTISVPVPSIPEQAQIVLILDSVFSHEQQAKEAAEAVLDQIDTMKKAILARAFRGELGTNEPSEEWAGELLTHLWAEVE